MITESTPYFSKTRRGLPALTIQGYIYNIQLRRAGKVRWVCAHRRGYDTPYFPKTARGQPALTVQGYRYSIHRRQGLKVRWTCDHRRGCNSAVYTVQDEIVAVRGEHNHPPKIHN
ncbi:hypothetical protein EVAR_17877_1 [Eumeta japonica]|uniref:FLYWCH-type domain-containing protein n=1 Tax=Eumeta variegata TaxID=151549 RepID=A0A4C1UYT3_EUMVA|nr:hypothetical protein EVAR_17877_1 [Eumeta japonica]